MTFVRFAVRIFKESVKKVFAVLLMWVAIFAIGLLLLLSACESEPDMSHRVPKEFPIEKTLYSKGHYLSCAVNVFALEENFREQFSEEFLRQLDAKEEKRIGRALKNYHKWYKTPVYKNIYEMSKAGSAVSCGEELLEEAPYLLDVFKKYSSKEDGAYFRDDHAGGILLYLPRENILIFSEWD